MKTKEFATVESDRMDRPGYQNGDRLRRRRVALSALVCVVGLGGCHWDMWNEARIKPLEAGVFFADSRTSLNFVEGAVSYEQPRLDEHYFTGKINGEFAMELPASVELNRELLDRGHNRFNVYCTPCHGLQGNGDGMIVKRGFPAPPSYHIDRLREAGPGYTFDVITNGFGRMYSYATRVPVADRWAIAAYVKALQLSQNATPDLLPADVLEQARNPQPAETEESHESNEHH